MLMSVCHSVCLYAFFSAISKPTGMPFGTQWAQMSGFGKFRFIIHTSPVRYVFSLDFLEEKENYTFSETLGPTESENQC